MAYKQVIVVVKDLKMSKGKTAAQVAHGSVGAVLNCDRKIVESWMAEGFAKIVCKADETEFDKLQETADNKGITTYRVRDFGRTELEPNTLTVLAIGPDKESKINSICKELELL